MDKYDLIVSQYIDGEWVELITLPTELTAGLSKEEYEKVIDEMKDVVWSGGSRSNDVIVNKVFIQGKKDCIIFNPNGGPVKIYLKMNHREFNHVR